MQSDCKKNARCVRGTESEWASSQIKFRRHLKYMLLPGAPFTNMD